LDQIEVAPVDQRGRFDQPIAGTPCQAPAGDLPKLGTQELENPVEGSRVSFPPTLYRRRHFSHTGDPST